MPRVAARPVEPSFPPVAVILPIKGVDADTPGNLAALLAQDYPAYRLIFSVASEDDQVVPLIERLAAEAPRGKIEIVVAGPAEHRGQKVHNQLAAVERTTDADEVLAFVDADAHPDPSWLHALVVPLTYGEHIGASTGYRFYIPAVSHPANAVVSVINAGVAALFGPYRRTFAWGGSMALRRRDFFSYGIHAAWQNALSDDYVVSHCVKHLARRKIHYVPRCLVASAADFNWPSFFEFAIRQYRITRICAPLVWLVAVGGPAVYLTSLLYTLINGVYSAFVAAPPAAEPLGLLTLCRSPAYEPYRMAVMFISLYTLSIIRGYLLLYGARRLLPERWPAIRKMAFWFTFGYPLVQMVNLASLLMAGFGRKVVWRGVTYMMVSRTETIVSRGERTASRGTRGAAKVGPRELQTAERE